MHDDETFADPLITVSNGSAFVRIPESKLSTAQTDGFYRPGDLGLLIVASGDLLFEVPIADAKRAVASGNCALLDDESASVVGLSKTSPSNDDIDSFLLLDGLSQAEREAEQAQLEREQLISETSGWRKHTMRLKFWFESRRSNLLQQLGGSGISILVHVTLLLILASLVLVQSEPEKLVLMASPSTSEDVLEEIVIDPMPMEITEPTEEMQSEAPPEAQQEVAIEIPDATPDFLGAVSGDAVKPPAMPSIETGQGDDAPSKKPTFFGSKFAAINYVFVIDNSNSMTGGRFETAINELMITVNRLTPKQRFYVIFYSDTAYPMMHPRPAKELVSATPQNKQLLFRWLQTVELCLKTNGREAIQAAFDLDPDVIYVLGDGAFTDKAAEVFAKKPHPRIIVNTRGMEVKEKDAIAFKLLAETHRGDYMDVGVAPQGALMAKQYPRRRNNTRGPIWGLTLPLDQK